MRRPRRVLTAATAMPPSIERAPAVEPDNLRCRPSPATWVPGAWPHSYGYVGDGLTWDTIPTSCTVRASAAGSTRTRPLRRWASWS
jgi:hypothetical protein